MYKRKIFTFTILAALIISLVIPGGPTFAQGPQGQGKGPPVLKGKVTKEEKLAAGQAFAEAFATVVGPGIQQLPTSQTHWVDPDTGILFPHYYGPYPNYALSPLPIVDPVTGLITDNDSGIKKFVDSLPGLTPAGSNNLDQYIPVAVADTTSYPGGGSGYTSPPAIEIMDSTGTGAAATAEITPDGVVTNVIITDNGTGYSAYPKVIFSGGGASVQAIGIPVVVNGEITAITLTGADYYEIALVEFQERMHTDLPPTTHRGYVQLSTDVVGDNSIPLYYLGTPTQIVKGDGTGLAFAVDNPHYLGPAIVAQRNKPVRIKFYNLLPTGDAGDLFIPVDTTVMGAGMGPAMDMLGGASENYTQNRATLHLHGGITPWISDGTPHQWITPAGENTAYPQGVSVSPVPDMNDSGDPKDGVMTFYYTNEQSARLMFYHDHAFGITRLNVYAGEAAPYLIRDSVEDQLVADGIIPADEIPLVIQDKTFVPDPTITGFSNILGDWENQMSFYDPTWDYTRWGGFGNLWYPHVYMPVQNPWAPDGSGINAFGRWHYGPWFWPPVDPINDPAPNPYADMNNPLYDPNEPPLVPGVPLDSMGMESFFDTPVVNGTAYPFLNVEPKAYRFRILNAANDRFWNLQLYIADPDVVTADGRRNTEVKMVPASPNTGLPADWPTDGREGGVPDPTMAGPDWIQIGNEGGFLPEPAVIPTIPVSWNLDATTFNAGLVNGGSLMLGPAERADVVVDFSQYAGKTLILYNDAPAPWPAWTPQYDYYTGSPDLTETGGAPGTLPGYGPNTRTIMQIVVSGTSAMQVDSIKVSSQGSGYTNPDVELIGGNPNTPAAGEVVGSLDRISLSNFGANYTSPMVTIDSPDDPLGVQATAAATVNEGYITRITVTNSGSGYNTAPGVSITDPTGGGAIARATLKVSNINITNGGEAYISVPLAVIREADELGDGDGATATATLVNAIPLPAYNLTALNETFIPTNGSLSVFQRDQREIIVGQSAYDGAYNMTFPTGPPTNWGVSGIGDSTLTFQTVSNGVVTRPMEPKAIQDEMGEAFDVEYGRMSGFLGLEVPRTVAGRQLLNLFPFLSPPVEVIATTADIYATQIGDALADGTQIWKITHNGVDTHPVHWHMFEVQLINRVAWDNAIRLPDPNELGWKDTIKISPLEDTIVALRPIVPTLPFDIPNSVRLIDPTRNEGDLLPGGPGGFFDPLGNPVTILNHYVNLGWEYVWHCHILSHEEMDMMHSMAVAVPPKSPSNLTALISGGGANRQVLLSWTDESTNETSFTVQRAAAPEGPWTDLAAVPSATGPTVGGTIVFTDPIGNTDAAYFYRVFASNTVGDITLVNFPTVTLVSDYSNTVNVGTVTIVPPLAPTALTAVVQTGPQVLLTWVDNANNETGFVIERSTDGGVNFSTLVTIGPRVGIGNVNYTDTTVTAGSTYVYRVGAINAAGLSGYSNPATVQVISPPTAPTGVTATASRIGAGPNDRIVLNWVDVASETGYTIQMATNATFTANLVTTVVGPNTTTFDTGNVARFTQYYLRIQAFNGAGQSIWVNAAPFPVTTP